MEISEKKMQIVINNYFKQECNVNTSIREAFEKGFRIGIKKASSAQSEPDLDAIRKEAYDKGYKTAKHEKEEDKESCQNCQFAKNPKTQEPCGRCSHSFYNFFRLKKQKKEEIKVGDEYCYAGKYRCVITEITDNFYRILWNNGTSTIIGELTYIKPTGRHFPEIAEVLQKMKETES